MFDNSLFSYGRRGIALALLVTGSFLVTGCGDDDDDVDDDVSAVSGRVDGGVGGTAPAQIEGATVSLARINSSGNLETVSSEAATSDAEGRFRVETDLDNVRYLVVVADKGSTHLEAVVADAVQNGSEIKSQPLTQETTVEARVWRAIVADNKTSSVSLADVATYITPSVASGIAGNAAAIEAIATALEAEGDVRNAALADAEFGVTTTELNVINQARANALANLDEALLAADTQAEIDAAWQAWYTADAAAYATGSVDLDAILRAREIASRALLNSTGSLSPSVELSVVRGAALARAAVLTMATQDAFLDANATAGERTTVANAGTTLINAIKAATTEQAILNAFDTYHDTLLARLQVVYPLRSTALTTVNDALYASSGPRATLLTTVGTSTNPTVLVPAYVDYFNSATTAVSTSLVGAPQAEIDIATRVLLDTSLIM
ncbi:MAG TPA: hypothetical protein VF720_00355 [Candidatus Eisenbacteria bacterium]